MPSGNQPLPELVLTHIYVPHGFTRPQWVNIGSGNDLPLVWHQDINYNADCLPTGHLETNFFRILIAIWIFFFKKMDFKMLSTK